MPALYLHRFSVEGNTQFPFDMLRYDRCTPDTELDSYHIIHTCKGIDGAVRVCLQRTCTSKHWKPTEGRWQSFCWQVVRTEPAFKQVA